jgi:minor histocompatibility antigen H13
VVSDESDGLRLLVWGFAAHVAYHFRNGELDSERAVLLRHLLRLLHVRVTLLTFGVECANRDRPMMVTVAKSLDVPIKLVFPRPAPAGSTSTLPSLAMLGLGDVVLPGIMIGLALRFDLFLFYLRKQKSIPSVTKDEREGAQQSTVEKAKYFSMAGRWSDHFWTHSLFGRPLFAATQSKPEQPFTFPKTYFKASLVGYVVGMLTTLGVMHVWGHAQPALLYLVPGVLGSLWLTALARGEYNLMWEFSEAVEEEDDGAEKKSSENKDTDKSKSAPERSSFFSMSDKKAKDREDRMKKSLRQHVTIDSESENENRSIKTEDGSSRKVKVKAAADHKSEREVFSISIEAPWKLKHPHSIRSSSSTSPTEAQNGAVSPIETDKPNWAATESAIKAGEPAGKRLRLSK